MGKIPVHWMKKFEKTHFGSQTICGLQLLSMSKPYASDGYYRMKARINLAKSCTKVGRDSPVPDVEFVNRNEGDDHRPIPGASPAMGATPF